MARFMYGRNGVDQLGLFTLAAYLVIWLVQLVTGWTVLAVVEYLLLFLTLFRMVSRNLARRREENTRFLQVVRPLQRRWTTLRSRMQDKEHRYFKCPNCGQQMRVPRGKGRITVHCRNCGASFEEKS
jgi:predicted RNA-binding Zn-ribbon protein involved in translation (DUF1610 family)